MGKPREDDQPQDQNLAREQLFSRASRGLLELGQALGIAEPAQVRGAETPREPGHGFRPGEAVPLESIVRSWLGLAPARRGAPDQSMAVPGRRRTTIGGHPAANPGRSRTPRPRPGARGLRPSDCVSYPRPVKTSRPAGCCGCSRPEAYNRSVGAVYPQSRHLPAKLRAFFDHLVGHFEPGPDR